MKIINLKYRKYCFVVTMIIMIIQTVCKQIYILAVRYGNIIGLNTYLLGEAEF